MRYVEGDKHPVGAHRDAPLRDAVLYLTFDGALEIDRSNRRWPKITDEIAGLFRVL